MKRVWLLSLTLLAQPVMAHHSFAMYDQSKVVTFTGVVTRFVAQPNHAEIHFVPLGRDGKPVRGADGTWLASKGPPIHSLALAELSGYDIGRVKRTLQPVS